MLFIFEDPLKIHCLYFISIGSFLFIFVNWVHFGSFWFILVNWVLAILVHLVHFG